VKDKLDFLKDVYRVAKPVSDATGLSLPFILAHAAHETGWGKNVNGNNLFNLKADEGWEGPAIIKGNATYREYPSYEESMKDYLGYLRDNPRFGTMFEPATRGGVEKLANAIHYAGYRDDPLYRMGIMAAAQEPLMKWALWQCDRRKPEG
jgi:flagellar protein FlgJ